MSERKKLQPAEGCLVRHPADYHPIPAEGEVVEMTSYWVRKLRSGDVVEVAEAEPGQKKAAGGK